MIDRIVDMAGSSKDNAEDVFAALGDPLIKGLTEVANQRPKDPIAFLATYLYNFANQNKTRLKTQVIILRFDSILNSLDFYFDSFVKRKPTLL